MGEASEMSSMSEMSQASEASSVSGAGAGGDSGSKKKMFILLGIGLGVVVVGAALLALGTLSGEAKEPDNSADDSPPSSGSGTGTGNTDGFTERGTPGQPTATTGSSEAEGKTTTERPQLQKIPMLCTVGKFALTRSEFPPDGVCDLIFFTHVFYTSTDNHFHGTFDDAFQVFKKVSAQYSLSQFGMSMSERYTNTTGSGLSAAPAMAEFKQLMDRRIVHHGLLSVTGDPTPFLPVLKELKDLQVQNNPDQAENKKNFVALGLQGGYGKTATFGDWIDKAKSTPYDIIVLHTHISNWDPSTIKGTSGASIWDSKNHKYCSMKGAISQLDANNFPAAPKTPVLMLSLTMTVHMFTLPANWKDDGKSIEDDKTALSVGEGDYSETCGAGAEVEKKPERFMVKAVRKNFQIIYDTSVTMIEKIDLAKAELAKKTGLPRQGWAIFDVEQEDSSKVCSKTQTGFDRLQAVRDYLNTAGAAP